ncbi:MAG: hypothetical protein RBS78_03045 [Coriobacteriia bacterium]|jgi:hypothetical protein|nr:hypothetical protein [Coriobacteriia bacterium]
MAERITASTWRVTGTVLMWATGLALVAGVAPLVRVRVPLSDELDLAALVMPVCSFLQIVVVAAFLRVGSPSARRWSIGHRAWFAVAAVAAGLLLGPSTLSLLGYLLFGPGLSVLWRDPLQVQLLWSVPAMLYVPAAATLAVLWVRDPTRPLARMLAVSTLVLGSMSIVMVFWFTHLWATYVAQ